MPILKPAMTSKYKLFKNVRLWGKNSPVYIVVHFTGGISKNGDTQGAMTSIYKSYVERGSNAHYLVGRDSIWEMVNPKIFYCTYSCGSHVGKKSVCSVKGWGPSAYASPLSLSHAAIAGHSNTINVEICSCKVGKKRCDPMDDGWYFNDSTYNNAVTLCAWLCDEFSIAPSNIIMHNQVTGKLCPAMWCNKPGAEEGYETFKQDVISVLNTTEMSVLVNNQTKPSSAPKPESNTIQVKADSLFYSRPSEDSPIIGYADSDQTLEYTSKYESFYYTDYGWVK